ncbi:hypothetical protein CTheo_7963 [Ceratobasidium theobromae]|uniref:F-box domain-containing protein n=1 Tax=Ceratobasidium theobromae TaxID=1582974 RepID=A0A5N5QB29_9AGAM|nr:hypothetical protein CTheo_7963 [Ceratobasidium theobromae]
MNESNPTTQPELGSSGDEMDNSRLRSFVDLPLELLIEVAKYLQPLDLIQASRANKSFRSLFMRRSVTLVWETAFRNVEGLPPCPEGCCEPRYAALIFLEECSICGQPSPVLYVMDPGALARLCSKCRSEERTYLIDVKHPDLVFASYVFPHYPPSLTRWCLSRDVKHVEATYEALIAAGDEETMVRWVNKRRELVADWDQVAIFLGASSYRHHEQLQAINRLKEARQAEIKSRLRALGWHQADFHQYKKLPPDQWNSLLYKAELLDDQVWENILPQLLEHVKGNRDQRFQNEVFRRKEVRALEIKYWLEAVQDNLPPLVLVTRKPNNSGEGPLEQSRALLPHQVFPTLEIIKTWPEYETLVETDLPSKAFRAEFRRKQGQLTRLIADWRYDAETAALEVLPKDTLPASSHGIEFDLTTIAGDDTQPFDYLPMDTRRLLRADATFSNNQALGFYPGVLCNWTEATILEYDYNASKIAKALLRTLGRPEASYPEMVELYHVFVCGRCHDSRSKSWLMIVQHFYDEWLRWQGHSGILSACAEATKSPATVFTHDVDSADPKPLIRIVKQD